MKNLRISVNNVVTRPTSAPMSGVPGPAHRKLLSEVVSACQPAEGVAANVITAGDHDLNISGEFTCTALEDSGREAEGGSGVWRAVSGGGSGLDEGPEMAGGQM